MTLDEIAQKLSDSSVGTAIRESGTLFPWIESIHVLMIATVVGTIAIVDLRLLGYSAHRRGARQLIVDMLPFTWVAFLLAVVSGALLFTSNATQYILSTPFKIKMLLLLLAGINMAVFHLTAYRRIDEWNDDLPTPRAAKISGALSLTFWLLVVCFGRWIGFSAPLA